MPRTVTARAAAGKAGVPAGAMTTTPYRRGPRGEPVWLRVGGARRVGRHVELRTEDGKALLVDLRHPIFEARNDPGETHARPSQADDPRVS